MEDLETKYQILLKECLENENIIGLYFGGSRGKSDEFITVKSDMDVYVILSDTSDITLKENLLKYASEYFEIRVMFLNEFIKYAEWGSDREWDRYNFAHNKATVDKTGEIQKLIDEKGILPAEFKDKVIKDSLDSYLNQVYRSAKYFRDGRDFPAHLDALESLPFLMTALYALEGRLRPYNKYFKWELRNYPLKLLPWSLDEFISDYKQIIETGDINIQEKIFKTVKKLFIDNGYKEIFDEWNNYYFVGK